MKQVAFFIGIVSAISFTIFGALRIGDTIDRNAQEQVAFYDATINISSPVYISTPTPVPEPSSPEELLDDYIKGLCFAFYPKVDPYLVHSIIWHESRYNPNTIGDNGNSIGLMQINTQWHKQRMLNLEVTDLYEPFENVLVGIDYLNELLIKYEDPKLVVMLYNMKHDSAFRLYEEGKMSGYAKSVLERMDKLKQGGDYLDGSS